MTSFPSPNIPGTPKSKTALSRQAEGGPRCGLYRIFMRLGRQNILVRAVGPFRSPGISSGMVSAKCQLTTRNMMSPFRF